MLISVIVPVYNTAPYLPKCLNSILAQTHHNLEIILIDDGSEDNSGAICDEYAKKDQRIKAIHQANGGLSSARNAGLDIATGDYIAFIDSDDLIAPEMFSTMLAAIERENADLAICGIKPVDENGREVFWCGQNFWNSQIKNGVMDNKQILLSMFETIPPMVCNRLYKQSLVENIRFPPDRLMEDVFINHHIFGKCQKVVTLEEQFYIYLTQRQGRITSIYSEKHSLDEWSALYDRYLFFQSKGKGFGNCRRHSLQGLCYVLIEVFENLDYAEHKLAIAPLYQKTLWLLARYGDLRAGKLFLYRHNPAFAKRLVDFIEPLLKLHRRRGKNGGDGSGILKRGNT